MCRIRSERQICLPVIRDGGSVISRTHRFINPLSRLNHSVLSYRLLPIFQQVLASW